MSLKKWFNGTPGSPILEWLFQRGFYRVFARWEAETTANTIVFEGQVAKNTVIYSVIFNPRQKTLVFTMFSFTP